MKQTKQGVVYYRRNKTYLWEIVENEIEQAVEYVNLQLDAEAIARFNSLLERISIFHFFIRSYVKKVRKQVLTKKP
jgi:predicted oxidoreductase (fatty acid repression mutant protein)